MPPAGALTTILIGCDGASCAAAGAAAKPMQPASSAAPRPRATRELRTILFPPDVVCFAADNGGDLTAAQIEGTGEARCRARSPAARRAESRTRPGQRQFAP